MGVASLKRRRPRPLALLACIALVGACQQFDPPFTAYQAAVGHVAVATPAEMPVLEFEGFPGGKSGAAAVSAGGMFLGCTAQLAAGTACAGPLCPGLVAIVAGLCGVTALTTGTIAAWTTPSAATQAQDREAAATALAAGAMQGALEAELAAAAARAGLVVDAGSADTLLEARVTHIGAQGNELMRPRIVVAARLLRAPDRQELTSFDVRWTGTTRDRQAWLADEARALRDALDAGYVEVAQALVDRAFLLYPLPDRLPHVRSMAAQFGLAAREPPTRVLLSPASTLPEALEWAAADSNRPRLRWQAFPRRGDREIAAADMARVMNVRYELVIARERHDAPPEVVYRRDALPKPEHRVETALEPDARYFWTVRARFRLDDRERVTEWSAMVQRDFESATAPSVSAYRFRTPP